MRWHKWFAWRPVRIDERIYWLETIERMFQERVYEDEDFGPYYVYTPRYRVLNHVLKTYAK